MPVQRNKPDQNEYRPFHCHMEQHIPLGMMFALNILPSKVPAIPSDAPTEGPADIVIAVVLDGRERR